MEQEIGVVLRRHRRLHEIPLIEVAAKLGISHVHLSNIERGISSPSPALLVRLREAYGYEEGFVCPTCQGKGVI